jgi:hypothetical protein
LKNNAVPLTGAGWNEPPVVDFGQRPRKDRLSPGKSEKKAGQEARPTGAIRARIEDSDARQKRRFARALSRLLQKPRKAR